MGSEILLELLAEGHTPHEIAIASGLMTTEIVYFRATRSMPLSAANWDAKKWDTIKEKLGSKPKPESSEEGEKRKAGRPPKAEKEA